jgi:hypothetical protein
MENFVSNHTEVPKNYSKKINYIREERFGEL